MAHTTNSVDIKNPGTLKIPVAITGLFGILFVLGLAFFVGGLYVDSQRAWISYLVGYFYFFSLAIGGLFFASIQWITSSMWSAPIRRIAESFTYYLPLSFVAFLVLFFGLHDIYHWTHEDVVAKDIVLQGKEPYLNIPFLMIRTIIAYIIWGVFAYFMVGNSLKQDQDGDYKYNVKNRVLAPIFIMFFAISFTMTSFDLLMSLDPHWFSTIYGIYTFAGAYYITHALICILGILLKRAGYLQGIFNENHIHDLGKFMFAFAVFWAYIGFSQYMLIWYANIPEETIWYMRRMENGWLPFSILLFIGKFVVPFFVLLPRSHKRNENILLGVGAWMLLMHFVDLMWLAQPDVLSGGPRLGWIELGGPFLFLGLFGFAVLFFFSKNSVLAHKDPRLLDSLNHHQ